jgi:hypothetical protein
MTFTSSTHKPLAKLFCGKRWGKPKLIFLSSEIFIGGHGDYKLISFHHTKSYSIFSTIDGKTLRKTNLGKKIYFL